MARIGYRTGRADKVRDFLAIAPAQAHTVLEIADGIGFTDRNRDPLFATVCTLVTRGELLKIAGGRGQTRYRLAPSAPARPRHRNSPPVPAPKVGLATASPRPRRTRAPRVAPVRHKPGETNFSAAPGTVDHSLDPRRAASARIAADIAAFEAAGGRIERLGVTRLFHHIADNDDQE